MPPIASRELPSECSTRPLLLALACSFRPTGSLSQAAASVPRSGVAAIGSISFLCAGVRDRIRGFAGRRPRQETEETDSNKSPRPEPESRVYWKQPRATATSEEGRAEGKWRRAAAEAEPRDGCSALLGGGRAAHFFPSPCCDDETEARGAVVAGRGSCGAARRRHAFSAGLQHQEP